MAVNSITLTGCFPYYQKLPITVSRLQVRRRYYLNRAPAPVETYNDLDGEVVYFFRVLRDRQEELIRAIGLTLFRGRNYA